MARPMLLIKEPLLRQLWLANEEGIPLSKLLRKHHIPLSPPTLAKLINFMSIIDSIQLEAGLRDIVYKSVFPQWLAIENGSVHKQPENWHYRGKMPFGYWEQSKVITKEE